MLEPAMWGTIGQGRSSPPYVSTKLITAPTVEPFTLEQAKLHCHITGDDENAGVVQWIRAARAKVEQDTQRALLTQTWDVFVDASPSGWDWFSVPFPPLQSVTSVNQTDTAGAETVWNATNYVVDTASEPGRIALTDSGTWPTSVRRFQPIRIRYVAGWTAPELIPSDLLQAVALWIGWFAEHREPSALEREVYDSLIGNYLIFSAA